MANGWHRFPDFMQVCVFTAPLFSAFCALACYGLVKEVGGVAGSQVDEDSKAEPHSS
jgi:hypothetical protein